MLPVVQTCLIRCDLQGWPLAQTCDQHRGIVNQSVVPTDHLEWTSHTLNSKGLTMRLERQLCGMQACCLFNWLQDVGLLISSCWILWCNDTIVASKRREAWILPNMSLFVVLFPVIYYHSPQFGSFGIVQCGAMAYGSLLGPPTQPRLRCCATFEPLRVRRQCRALSPTERKDIQRSHYLSTGW